MIRVPDDDPRDGPDAAEALAVLGADSIALKIARKFARECTRNPILLEAYVYPPLFGIDFHKQLSENGPKMHPKMRPKNCPKWGKCY